MSDERRLVCKAGFQVTAVTERFFLTGSAAADGCHFPVDAYLLLFRITHDEIAGDQRRSVLQDLDPGELGFLLGCGARLGRDELGTLQVGKRPGRTGVDDLHDLLAVRSMDVDPGLLLGIEHLGQADQAIGRMNAQVGFPENSDLAIGIFLDIIFVFFEIRQFSFCNFVRHDFRVKICVKLKI
jgi:hypothetical protein